MERLRELRKRSSLTMKQLGAELGLAESTVSLYENGKRTPDVQTMIRFADFFGVTLDYLCDRADASPVKSKELFQTSPHEAELIRAYRMQPSSVQEAICDILHIEHMSISKAN